MEWEKSSYNYILGIGFALLNIPFALFLGKKFGINGVLAVNIILGLLGAIISPLQYKRIINQTAVGIWNK